MFKTLVTAAALVTSAIAPACLVANTSMAAEQEVEQEWRFRVMLDDREIGTHEFRVNPLGEGKHVEINASFDVKLLFFTAYSYRHSNIERWEDGCLKAIESITDDNGTEYRVEGQARDEGFVVDATGDDDTVGPACTRSFAYWNPEFLDSSQLLNSQTGEIVDVEISRQADEVLQVDGQPVAAERYALEMADGTISLWYARESGQWLALEAPARGDRVLRYEPIELPFQLNGSGPIAME